MLLDHRRGLQQVLVPLRQAIDARGEHALDRRRHLERVDGRGQLVRPADAFEAASLDQRLDDFFDEERVAPRARVDTLGQRGQRLV